MAFCYICIMNLDKKTIDIKKNDIKVVESLSKMELLFHVTLDDKTENNLFWQRYLKEFPTNNHRIEELEHNY